MSPELRARIVQSLKSDARSRAGGASSVRGSRLFRLSVFLVSVVVAGVLTVTFRQSRQEFRVAKAALLSKYRKESAPFDADFEKRLSRIDALLETAHEKYPGDHLSPPLRTRGVSYLDEVLSQPLVYVRGPTRGFQKQRERRSVWAEGGPDAFVRCLIEPPKDIEESTLLQHLGHVYQPRVLSDRFVNVDLAHRGVEFVGSSFSNELRSAKFLRNVESLARRLEHAELREAAVFSNVRYFTYVLDEPKAMGVASDFDGEAEHHVRTGILDLQTGEHVLRLRRLVSPEWISEKSRLAYSRELDSCRLAHEIRTELRPPSRPK